MIVRVNIVDEARRTHTGKVFALNGGPTGKSMNALAQPGHATQSLFAAPSKGIWVH